MGGIDGLRRIAAEQRFLVSRDQVSGTGLGDKYVRRRVDSGQWLRVHSGVYQVDFRPVDWEGALMAAVLAAGPMAVVSHRAALVVWGLDGIGSAPLELTVPFNNHPIPAGVVVHRTRRQLDVDSRRGLPITTVERTLLDCAGTLPRLTLGKAVDSAIRKQRTSLDRVYDALVAKGGRGVRGTRALTWVLRERLHDTATGSGSEFELLYHMQMAFLPRPELQHPLWPDSGRRVPDFFWPELNKAVEVDGVDAHASADSLDDDLKRQNDLLDLGIELRRFSAREVRRHPEAVVARIRQFLES